MLFNSLDFAVFLPIVFILYWWVTNKNLKAQNVLIVLASYVFYGWWDWRFLSLILFSTIIDYSIGLYLKKNNDAFQRKVLLWISIAINLGFLGFFKYYNFFVENFVEAFTFFGSPISLSSLYFILPVVISFYTFQTLSYTIDVYRKKLEPTKDFIAFTAFVSFFPQLVAGPIERATNLLPQFYKKRTFNGKNAIIGVKQIIWGLFKKVVIADNCAQYANDIFSNYEGYSSATLLLGAIYFSFQIYGDFSGYSDIAIGTARLFDFDLKKNFKYPYFSRDIAEFWRRWHISLSTWFRDYVYIPLGGSRVATWLKVRNTFIIFIVSGFWHGANWTFVIWGAIHGLYQIIEKNIFKVKRDFKPRFYHIIFIYALTCLAWIFFRATSLSDASTIFVQIFTDFGTHLHIGDLGIFLYALMGLSVLFVHDLAQEYFPKINLLHHHQFAIRIASILFLMIYIISFGVFDGSQFIYFQF
mgnify:CR=1 FL=1